MNRTLPLPLSTWSFFPKWTRRSRSTTRLFTFYFILKQIYNYIKQKEQIILTVSDLLTCVYREQQSSSKLSFDKLNPFQGLRMSTGGSKLTLINVIIIATSHPGFKGQHAGLYSHPEISVKTPLFYLIVYYSRNYRQ